MLRCDAVDVEEAFQRFFDEPTTRAEVYDADYVRSLEPKHLGRALERLVGELGKRIRASQLSEDDKEDALEGVAFIEQSAVTLMKDVREQDPHMFQQWATVAGFVRIIETLLA